MGIQCAERGCLASISWFGHSTDPALANLARQKGWAVFEGSGWRCRRHGALPPPPVTEGADEPTAQR